MSVLQAPLLVLILRVSIVMYIQLPKTSNRPVVEEQRLLDELKQLRAEQANISPQVCHIEFDFFLSGHQ